MLDVRLLLVGHQLVTVVTPIAELLLLLGKVLVARKVFLVEHDLVSLRVDAESGSRDASDNASTSGWQSLDVSAALMLTRMERQVRWRSTTAAATSAAAHLRIFRLLTDWPTVESSSSATTTTTDAAEMMTRRIWSLTVSFS
jgi:hypothetical protein